MMMTEEIRNLLNAEKAFGKAADGLNLYFHKEELGLFDKEVNDDRPGER